MRGTGWCMKSDDQFISGNVGEYSWQEDVDGEQWSDRRRSV